MSLINKMLKDLEQRQSGAPTGGRAVFQDLQPVGERSRPAHGLRNALLVLGLGLLAGYGGWRYLTAPVATPVAAPMAHSVEREAPPPASVPAVAPEPAVAVTPPPPEPAAVPRAAKPDAPRPRAAPPAAVTAPEPVRIEKTERPYTPEETAEHAHRQALRFQVQGNPAGAERQWRDALSALPAHRAARERLAVLMLEGGRHAEARGLLEEGIALSPEHGSFSLLLARVHVEQGGEAQAIAVLEQTRALAQSTRDADSPALLAALYQRAGRNDDAVNAYRDALAIRPDESRWWVGLGIALEGQGDSVTARGAYQRALGSGRLPPNLARYADDRIKALTAR